MRPFALPPGSQGKLSLGQLIPSVSERRQRSPKKSAGTTYENRKDNCPTTFEHVLQVDPLNRPIRLNCFELTRPSSILRSSQSSNGLQLILGSEIHPVGLAYQKFSFKSVRSKIATLHLERVGLFFSYHFYLQHHAESLAN